MKKKMMTVMLTTALLVSMSIPAAAPALAEQGIRDYYSCSENGQDEDGIHAGDVLRHEEKLINSKAETNVGGFYIVNTKGAPAVCPVCGHDQGFFIRLGMMQS